jgi:hypothetical protein
VTDPNPLQQCGIPVRDGDLAVLDARDWRAFHWGPGVSFTITYAGITAAVTLIRLGPLYAFAVVVDPAAMTGDAVPSGQHLHAADVAAALGELASGSREFAAVVG